MRASTIPGLLLVPLLACAGAPVRPAQPRLPLTLTYFGVAGWQISDGKHVILVDPYFSRPGDPWKDPSDPHAVAARAPPKADLVLVGHNHPDHALDAPAVALRTGAKLVGSFALAQQASKEGVPDDHLLPVKGGEDLEFDGFSVRVIPSLHSRTGFANGMDVETFAFLIRLAGHELLVFGTANFIEREVAGLRPDAIIVAHGLREEIHDYTCRLLRAVGSPAEVLTTHFDAWKKPPETPLSDVVKAELADFADEVHRCAPGTRVRVPQPFVAFPLE